MFLYTVYFNFINNEVFLKYTLNTIKNPKLNASCNEIKTCNASCDEIKTFNLNL